MLCPRLSALSLRINQCQGLVEDFFFLMMFLFLNQQKKRYTHWSTGDEEEDLDF